MQGFNPMESLSERIRIYAIKFQFLLCVIMAASSASNDEKQKILERLDNIELLNDFPPGEEGKKYLKKFVFGKTEFGTLHGKKFHSLFGGAKSEIPTAELIEKVFSKIKESFDDDLHDFSLLLMNFPICNNIEDVIMHCENERIFWKDMVAYLPRDYKKACEFIDDSSQDFEGRILCKNPSKIVFNVICTLFRCKDFDKLCKGKDEQKIYEEIITGIQKTRKK